VKYANMVELMSELGQAGFARVTLVTSIQPKPDSKNDGETETGNDKNQNLPNN
jgi:hypothetical protein